MEIAVIPSKLTLPISSLISLVKIGDTFLCPWVKVRRAYWTHSRGQHLQKPS